MNATERCLSRRALLKTLRMAGSGIAFGRWLKPNVMMAQELAPGKAIETFTGPGANPRWNSVGPYVAEPQKVPLILLTDRPISSKHHAIISARHSHPTKLSTCAGISKVFRTLLI
jgi:hypothetical protein